MRYLFHTIAITAVSVLMIGCTSGQSGKSGMYGHEDHAPTQVEHAIAQVQPLGNSAISGVIHFTHTGDGVRVTGTVRGLNPGQKHGFHIHEFGDLTADDGTSAGGHYNPEGHDHALPNGTTRHAGDFGNLHANAAGVASYDATYDNITIAGSMNPIIGRAVIIHAKPDDGGQPTGNAGARIAGGVIAVDGE